MTLFTNPKEPLAKTIKFEYNEINNLVSKYCDDAHISNVDWRKKYEPLIYHSEAEFSLNIEKADGLTKIKPLMYMSL